MDNRLLGRFRKETMDNLIWNKSLFYTNIYINQTRFSLTKKNISAKICSLSYSVLFRPNTSLIRHICALVPFKRWHGERVCHKVQQFSIVSKNRMKSRWNRKNSSHMASKNQLKLKFFKVIALSNIFDRVLSLR